MDDRDEVVLLLQEIRDLQREHLAEYRRVTERSLELQRVAVERQEAYGELYRRVVLLGGLVIVALMGLLLLLFRF